MRKLIGLFVVSGLLSGAFGISISCASCCTAKAAPASCDSSQDACQFSLPDLIKDSFQLVSPSGFVSKVVPAVFHSFVQPKPSTGIRSISESPPYSQLALKLAVSFLNRAPPL